MLEITLKSDVSKAMYNANVTGRKPRYIITLDPGKKTWNEIDESSPMVIKHKLL
jgi:hypothetical protein